MNIKQTLRSKIEIEIREKGLIKSVPFSFMFDLEYFKEEPK